MLSIGRLPTLGTADGVSSYLESVAERWSDYSMNAAEAPGWWAGRGAEGFGLGGEADPEAVRALFAFAHPQTGETLITSARGRPPRIGYDLTFSAPKSVSILHALGRTEIRRAVLEAHEAAVRDALTYLEDEALAVQLTGYRGEDGRWVRRSAPIHAMTVAAFTQRTNREAEPHLHTRCLVLNRGRTVLADGTDTGWRALDMGIVYRHARTAGMVYQSSLQRRLIDTVGTPFDAKDRNGQADIAAAPRSLVEGFSTRRRQILDALREGGYDATNREHREVAALATRKRKGHGGSAAALKRSRDRYGRHLPHADTPQRAARAAVAQAHGLTSFDGWVDQDVTPRTIPDAAAIRRWLEDPSERGPASGRSTFTRRELLQHLIVEFDLQEPWPALHDLIDEILASDAIRLLPDSVTTPGGEDLYTTPAALALESRIINRAVALREGGIGLLSDGAVGRALDRRPHLVGGEQAAALEHLSASGNGVDLLVGVAGAGKTTLLAAYHEAAVASGYTVLGAAVSGKAALGLRDETGIETYTVASLLWQIEHGRIAFDPTTPYILVVDEAATVNNADLGRLLDATGRANVKVVLVGDDAQLAIGPGGAVRGVAERVRHATLATSRRQHIEEHREALRAIRRGNVEHGLTVLFDRGDVTLHVDSVAAHSAMVADWLTASRSGEDAVMLAYRRKDVAHLNRTARAALRPTLGEDVAMTASGPAAIGDTIMMTKTDRRAGVANGMRGEILDAAGDMALIRLTTGTTLTVPTDYLREHATYGYAGTVHKVQGTTLDAAYVLTSGRASREWLYSALSRHRYDLHLYVAGNIDPANDRNVTADEAWDRLRRRTSSEKQVVTADAWLNAVEAHPGVVPWLQEHLPMPRNHAQRQQWRTAVRAVIDYRIALGYGDDTLIPALPDQANTMLRDLHRAAHAAVDAYRTTVERDHAEGHGLPAPAHVAYDHARRAKDSDDHAL